MKKLFIIAAITIGLSSLFQSCYNDISTLQDMDIPGIVIDTAGIRNNLIVGYLEPFTIAPKVTVGGVDADKLDLLYEWRINMVVNRTETDTIIGTEKVFSGIIINPIDTRPYVLRYKVTDPSTGISSVSSWSITVVSNFRDGILVCDSKNGTTSDFTLIMNNNLTVDWTGDSKIFRDILDNSIQGAYPGLLSKLYYYRYSNRDNYLLAFDNNDRIVRFLTLDFTMENMSDLFVYLQPNLKTYYINKPNQELFLITSEGVMVSNPTASLKFPGTPNIPVTATTVNNNVVAVDSWSNHGIPAAIWYDKPKGQFFWAYATMFAPYYRPFADNASEPFNAGSHPGKTAIAGDLTFDANTLAMLMKDDITGDYEICIFYKDPMGFDPGAQSLITVPEAGKALLDDALGYVFAQNQPVLYVVRSNGIYAIAFGVNPANVATAAKFTAPAGEQIKFAKLFEQGRYKLDKGDFSLPAELPLNVKSLIVATSGSNGKIYVLPMINLGTGDLDANNRIVYDGFGQILDVVNLGY